MKTDKLHRNELKRSLKIAQTLYWQARKINKDKTFKQFHTEDLLSGLDTYMGELKYIIQHIDDPKMIVPQVDKPILNEW